MPVLSEKAHYQVQPMATGSRRSEVKEEGWAQPGLGDTSSVGYPSPLALRQSVQGMSQDDELDSRTSASARLSRFHGSGTSPGTRSR